MFFCPKLSGNLKIWKHLWPVYKKVNVGCLPNLFQVVLYVLQGIQQCVKVTCFEKNCTF